MVRLASVAGAVIQANGRTELVDRWSAKGSKWLAEGPHYICGRPGGKQDLVCIPGIVSLVGGITISPGREAKCQLGRPTISLRRASTDTIQY